MPGDHRPSGIPSLDELLGGGLVLGDNVVWIGDRPEDVAPFCEAFLGIGDGRRRLLPLGGRSLAAPPGVEVSAHRQGASPADLAALERDLLAPELQAGDRVVVDGLDELVLRWGATATARFYQRTCPRLFDRGVLACWTGSRQLLGPTVVDEVTRVAQCAFDLRDERLRVVKAEGRPAKLQGALVDVDRSGPVPAVVGEHAVGRLGEGLRRLRRERNLTQGQLAALADVTPGAISQAETGRRGLSLDKLVPMCESLGVGLDRLLGTSGTPDHLLVRGDRQPLRPGARPIFDDPAYGLRAYAVGLAVDEDAAPPFAHKGVEVVVATAGLVLVDLGATTPVVRAGDSLMVTRVPIRRWRNLGPTPAEVLWLAVG